jgi:uncharacterized membrane-anchored protein
MNPQNLPEAKLAWIIWNALQQLSDRLWDRYDQDFVSFVMEKNDQEWLSTLFDTERIDGSSSQVTPSSGT